MYLTSLAVFVQRYSASRGHDGVVALSIMGAAPACTDVSGIDTAGALSSLRDGSGHHLSENDAQGAVRRVYLGVEAW
jgi:hypothetical protein